MSWTILNADARQIPMKDRSVQCVVTSPPYWRLRDYGQDSQIGLEKTPQEYVEKIVAVFREVKRVLRDDGVIFVNLGDSYCGSPTGKQSNNKYLQQGGPGDGAYARRVARMQTGDGIGPMNAIKSYDGLKPKDLCGVPWRVAFALQQPFYAGTIKRVEDRIWLAAMIDGEGCMFIHKRKVGQSNGQGYERKSDSYGAGLEVANCHESIIRRCMEITGRGSICFVDKESKLKNRNQRLFRWNLRSNECRKVIEEVYPYLVGKQHEARLVLGCPSSGRDAERAHANLIKLHNGFPSDIDFPAPKPMYQPGYYLRSDIIWSKCNPMPESVTDRPTKAHEYIFLLSKNERYFWDQDAVREPHVRLWDETNGGSWAHKEKFPKESAQGNHTGNYPTPNEAGRNIRTVWTIATQPYAEAHFATFPEELAERCIKAGSKAGDMVLDPFSGAGTTTLVADKLGRKGIGLELKHDYCRMAERRCYDDAPLLAARSA
jgi:DNA modification methylase